MRSVSVRGAVEADRRALAEFAAPLQARADRHIAYLAEDADTIAAGMIEEDDDWTAVSSVARAADGSLVGWLMGSVDPDMGRVWWYGPFVGADRPFADVADALFLHALERLDPAVTEHEVAIDAAFDELRVWAVGHGFVVQEGSLALELSGSLDPPELPVRPAGSSDVEAVARLHDELFPGTHIPGDRLLTDVGEHRRRLVLEVDGGFVGYVAVERQPDGRGYVDFLGVAPAHRGRGYGAQLVRGGVNALGQLGCSDAHLTVRGGNRAARTLYTRLGFVEARVLVPLRRGFSLP